MREYIVNLTNNLIGKHGFDLMFDSMKSRAQTPEYKEKFVELVHITIGSRDVREMSPETLGKVMCSFEGSELPAVTPSLFFGYPDEFLRNAVSRFLSYSIRYRLEVAHGYIHGRIPPYMSKNLGPQKLPDSGFKKVINDLAARRK